MSVHSTAGITLQRVLGLAACLFLGEMIIPPAVSADWVVFSNTVTKATASNTLWIGTWAARALEERYLAIGEPTELIPMEDSTQHYLEQIKARLQYLIPFFVCHTNAAGRTFKTYFRTPIAPGGTNYPTDFPMWTTTALLAHVGAPSNWFSETQWRPELTDSNGWVHVSNIIAHLCWTCRTSGDATDREERYSVGYSTNSYSEAHTREQGYWSRNDYYSDGTPAIYAAAVVVNARKNGIDPNYYVNGYRLYAKPTLNDIPTDFAHQASWYLRFEQVDGYTSTDYDHPYYNEDNSGGLNVNNPHMVYIEEKAASSLATEVGGYAFYGYKDIDPSVYGYVPASSYVSLVKYVCCKYAQWLIKWDVAGGFQYK